MDGELSMAGELEAKLLPKGEGAVPNSEPRTYPNFYVPPVGENPKPKLGLWLRAKLALHSWNLNRKIKAGKAPHGRTSESD